MSKDMTFSSADIIRFTAHNLSKEEKKDVLIFFVIILPAAGILRSTMEIILETLFKPSKVVFLLLRLIRIWESVVERLVDIDTNVLIWLLLSKDAREEARKAVDLLQKDFFLLK
jgi:hypothetical protein